MTAVVRGLEMETDPIAGFHARSVAAAVHVGTIAHTAMMVSDACRFGSLMVVTKGERMGGEPQARVAWIEQATPWRGPLMSMCKSLDMDEDTMFALAIEFGGAVGRQRG